MYITLNVKWFHVVRPQYIMCCTFAASGPVQGCHNGIYYTLASVEHWMCFSQPQYPIVTPYLRYKNTLVWSWKIDAWTSAERRAIFLTVFGRTPKMMCVQHSNTKNLSSKDIFSPCSTRCSGLMLKIKWYRDQNTLFKISSYPSDSKTYGRSIDPSLANPSRIWRGCPCKNLRLVYKFCFSTLLLLQTWKETCARSNIEFSRADQLASEQHLLYARGTCASRSPLWHTGGKYLNESLNEKSGEHQTNHLKTQERDHVPLWHLLPWDMVPLWHPSARPLKAFDVSSLYVYEFMCHVTDICDSCDMTQICDITRICDMTHISDMTQIFDTTRIYMNTVRVHLSSIQTTCCWSRVYVHVDTVLVTHMLEPNLNVCMCVRRVTNEYCVWHMWILFLYVWVVYEYCVVGVEYEYIWIPFELHVFYVNLNTQKVRVVCGLEDQKNDLCSFAPTKSPFLVFTSLTSFQQKSKCDPPLLPPAAFGTLLADSHVFQESDSLSHIRLYNIRLCCCLRLPASQKQATRPIMIEEHQRLHPV